MDLEQHRPLSEAQSSHSETFKACRETLSDVFKFLLYGKDIPARVSLKFLRDNRLSALFYLRLGERAHPLRQACATDFAYAFERRVKLNQAWEKVTEQLAQAGIENLSLGSLAYSAEIFGHPAARIPQDIDLLIHKDDFSQALRLLKEEGWSRLAGHPVLSRDGIELDLHTTPGEEARIPGVARAYVQRTQDLFAMSYQAAGTPIHTKVLRPEALLDNRVIHFFKHYCSSFQHGLELPLLLKRPFDAALLEESIQRSSSGKVWACVLEVLSDWGLISEEDQSKVPLSPSDRGFVKRSRVEKVLKLVSEGRGGRAPLILTAFMMPPAARIRYAWHLAWPARKILLDAYAEPEAGFLRSLVLRGRRLFKAISGVIQKR